ncbi:hypothetical protein PR048_008355 [Dryococelus australis]|uniref:Uncharacterized protein n=1 Tax=Dryococelus australis TaxID=614101 RepID=A0ABQ9HXN6_9NEOP|nr:hypothetical protein PR048_008355 [Dryococelus australis]
MSPTQPTANSDPTQSIFHVVNGGHFIHCVAWQHPATFKEIRQQYTAYVIIYYSQAHVVLDGYSVGPSTKYKEHLRRSGKGFHVDVTVEDSVYVILEQAEFLSNNSCKVLQVHANADVIIVSTTIAQAEKGLEAVLMGEDTDLLVLLVALTPPHDLLEDD